MDGFLGSICVALIGEDLVVIEERTGLFAGCPSQLLQFLHQSFANFPQPTLGLFLTGAHARTRSD